MQSNDQNPETLGTGDIRGVIAPEFTNNAKEGGALIPTILFGIPGSGNKVLLLGGLISSRDLFASKWSRHSWISPI